MLKIPSFSSPLSLVAASQQHAGARSAGAGLGPKLCVFSWGWKSSPGAWPQKVKFNWDPAPARALGAWPGVPSG